MIYTNIDDNIFNIFNGDERLEVKTLLEKIIKDIIDIEKLSEKNIYVNIEAVDKEGIKNLNCKYRNIDKVTDVLSFPIFEKEELDQIKEDKVKLVELEIGDIFLCLDVIKEQSIEYGTGVKRELLYMITHGMFHLLGYDHIDIEDKKIMRKKEEHILEKGDI